MNKDDIIKKLKDNRNILESYGVEKIGLFGSYLSNSANDESDIDILVKLGKIDTYKNYCKVKYFLENLFNKKIDLVTINQFKKKYLTDIGEAHQRQVTRDILEKLLYV